MQISDCALHIRTPCIHIYRKSVLFYFVPIFVCLFWQHVHVHILPRVPGDFAFNDDIYKELQNHDKVDKGWRNSEEMTEESNSLRPLFSWFRSSFINISAFLFSSIQILFQWSKVLLTVRQLKNRSRKNFAHSKRDCQDWFTMTITYKLSLNLIVFTKMKSS